jgi:hypothetical protein
VVVLVEVHHLESLELIGDFLDLVLLARLDYFHALGVPFDVLTGHCRDEEAMMVVLLCSQFRFFRARRVAEGRVDQAMGRETNK